MTLCAWIFRFQILVVALWVVWVSTDSQAQTGRLDLKVPEVVIVGGDVPIIREKRSVRIVPERLPAVQWVYPLSPRARVHKPIPTSFEPRPLTVRRLAKPDDCYADVLSSGQFVREEGAAAYFRSGYLAFLSKQPVKAERLFRAGLEKEPNSFSASFLGYWLGELLFERNLEKQALETWRRVADDPAGPYADVVAYKLGLLAYSKGNYDEARVWMEQVVTRFPNHPRSLDAHLVVAEISLIMNDFPRASWHFSGAGDLKSDDQGELRRGALLRGGLTYYWLRRYEDALPMLQEYIELGGTGPKNLRTAKVALGWSFYFKQEYVAAVRAFRKAANVSDIGEVPSYSKNRSDAFFGWLVSAVLQEKKEEVQLAWIRFNASNSSGRRFFQGVFRFAAWHFLNGRYKESADAIREGIRNITRAMESGEKDFVDLLARFRLLLAHSLYNIDDHRSQAAVIFESLLDSENPKSESLTLDLRAQASYGLIFSRLGIGDFNGAVQAADLFLAGFPEDEKAIEVYFWKGEALLMLARWAEARKSFGKVSSKHELGALAILGRAYTYYEAGLWKQAIPVFTEATKMLHGNPRLSAEAIAREADARYNTKDYIGAGNLYQKVLNDFPLDSTAESAALRLGGLRFHQAEYNEAEAAFSDFLRRWPKSSRSQEAQYWRGLAQIRGGRFALARVSLLRLVRDHPKSPLAASAWLQIGHAYYNEGRFVESGTTYSRVLSGNPSSKEAREARYGIVLAHLRIGNTEKTISEVRKFIDEEPDNELVTTLEFQVAEIYLAQKRYRDALASYVRVLRREGQESDVAHFRIGEIKNLMNKPGEAAEYYRDLLEQFPNSRIRSDARYKLAESLEAFGDCKRALTEYRAFLMQNSKHSLAGRARYRAGVCASRLKDEKTALQLFEKVLQNKGSPELVARSRYELGRLERIRGNFELALKHIQVAISSGILPELGGKLQFELGGLRESLKLYPQAVVEYLRVIYLYPEAKELGNRARIKVAGIYEKQGKFKQALSLYKEVAKGSAETSVRERAHARLLSLQHRLEKKSSGSSELRP